MKAPTSAPNFEQRLRAADAALRAGRAQTAERWLRALSVESPADLNSRWLLGVALLDQGKMRRQHRDARGRAARCAGIRPARVDLARAYRSIWPRDRGARAGAARAGAATLITPWPGWPTATCSSTSASTTTRASPSSVPGSAIPKRPGSRRRRGAARRRSQERRGPVPADPAGGCGPCGGAVRARGAVARRGCASRCRASAAACVAAIAAPAARLARARARAAGARAPDARQRRPRATCGRSSRRIRRAGSRPPPSRRACCVRKKSLAAYEQAAQLQPGEVRLRTSIGHVHKTLGHRAESEAAYKAALALDPDNAEAYWSLADLKNYTFSDAEIAAMRACSPTQRRPPGGRCAAVLRARQGLRAASSSIRRPSTTTRAATRGGGSMSRSTSRPSSGAPHASARSSMRISSPRIAGGGDASAAPIFIVGLPRSGSTLIEQILASHSQVEGTMELPNILNMVRDLDRLAPARQRLSGDALPPSRREQLGRARRPLPRGDRAAAPRPATLHRQAAEQLQPRRSDPRDPAARHRDRCAAPSDGLLLQHLQAALRRRPDLQLRPR